MKTTITVSLADVIAAMDSDSNSIKLQATVWRRGRKLIVAREKKIRGGKAVRTYKATFKLIPIGTSSNKKGLERWVVDITKPTVKITPGLNNPARQWSLVVRFVNELKSVFQIETQSAFDAVVVA